ncbi:hypothetical protein [Gordonia alkanivorans]|uniref:hypothetical protein n=1 Tax=Gordonia alkanivorans TaxID=84096 RepID=UPI0024B7569F|nr:hypothetical protein [Gordonia alkanivorans]MDJ0006525.1 hypothetical protein [Gordonia alkanivorans]MDJ0492153.1 hypothetical protein [Gordonia alkanivorans]
MNWSPAAWNDVSVVSIVILVAAAALVLIMTGRLVPRSHHQEVIARLESETDIWKTRALQAEDDRAQLTGALVTKNASEEANAHLLQSFREALETTRGAT